MNEKGLGEYRRLYQDFLTGNTGRQLRKFNPGVREVAYSLLICPGSNSWGLFYKPLGHLAHDMGRTEKQVQEAMKVLSGLDFAHYDPASEWIWIKQMAAIQHSPLPLKAGDNRIRSVRAWYAKAGRNPFLGPFFDLYDETLRLGSKESFPGTEVERRSGGDLVGVALQHVGEEVAEAGLFGEPPPAKALSAAELLMADFDDWWQHYPERKQIAKAEARAEWLKKKPKHDEQGQRVGVLEMQKQSRDWCKEDGQFIPAPAKYIKREQWHDTVGLAERSELSKVNESNRRTMQEIARDGKL